MKRILLLFLSLAVVACKPAIPIEKNESGVSLTRVDFQIDDTIWEHNTGFEFNKYIVFHSNTASLFYGKYDGGELQRWSDFYSSGYVYDGGIVYTFISYPQWGKDEYAHNAYVVEVGNGHTMRVNGVEEYTYYSPYTEDIEGQWMLIIAEPAPWN